MRRAQAAAKDALEAGVYWRKDSGIGQQLADSTMIDAIDQRIIRALQRDGRMTMQHLADEVGLSASPCARRVRMLEEAGIIKGYAAIIDEARLGFGVSVFVSVKLDRQVDDALRNFETQVKACPEVVDCWLMTGSRDYLIRIATSDLAAFEAYLTGKLTRIAGVSSIESSIPLRCVKSANARQV